MASLFKKKEDPQKMAREWKANIRKEIRTVERYIRDLDRSEKQAIAQIKENAKRGDKKSVNILTRELVNARKQKERLFIARSHLMSINTQLQSQMATLRVTGCLKQSSEVMQKMNDVVKIPELNRTMMEMGREMEKAGLIQEMMDEAMEEMSGVDEGEVETEVLKVYEELAIDVEERLGSAPQTKLEDEKVQEKEKEPATSQRDMDMLAQLQAL